MFAASITMPHVPAKDVRHSNVTNENVLTEPDLDVAIRGRRLMRIRVLPPDYDFNDIDYFINPTQQRKLQNKSNLERMEIEDRLPDNTLDISTNKPCPSQGLFTIGDVLGANRMDLLDRCRNCKPCYFVSRIIFISFLYQVRVARSILERSNNYDDTHGHIDTSDDSDSSTPIYYPPSVCEHNDRKATDNRNPHMLFTGPNGEYLEDFTTKPFYIEIVKDTQFLIEVKWNWVATRNKLAISAAIAPRTAHMMVTQLSLVKHRNILEQLANYMFKFFKDKNMDRITRLSQSLYFFSSSEEVTISDIITRELSAYETYVLQRNGECLSYPALLRMRMKHLDSDVLYDVPSFSTSFQPLISQTSTPISEPLKSGLLISKPFTCDSLTNEPNKVNIEVVDDDKADAESRNELNNTTPLKIETIEIADDDSPSTETVIWFSASENTSDYNNSFRTPPTNKTRQKYDGNQLASKGIVRVSKQQQSCQELKTCPRSTSKDLTGKCANREFNNKHNSLFGAMTSNTNERVNSNDNVGNTTSDTNQIINSNGDNSRSITKRNIQQSFKAEAANESVDRKSNNNHHNNLLGGKTSNTYQRNNTNDNMSGSITRISNTQQSFRGANISRLTNFNDVANESNLKNNNDNSPGAATSNTFKRLNSNEAASLGITTIIKEQHPFCDPKNCLIRHSNEAAGKPANREMNSYHDIFAGKATDNNAERRLNSNEAISGDIKSSDAADEPLKRNMNSNDNNCPGIVTVTGDNSQSLNSNQAEFQGNTSIVSERRPFRSLNNPRRSNFHDLTGESTNIQNDKSIGEVVDNNTDPKFKSTKIETSGYLLHESNISNSNDSDAVNEPLKRNINNNDVNSPRSATGNTSQSLNSNEAEYQGITSIISEQQSFRNSNSCKKSQSNDAAGNFRSLTSTKKSNSSDATSQSITDNASDKEFCPLSMTETLKKLKPNDGAFFRDIMKTDDCEIDEQHTNAADPQPSCSKDPDQPSRETSNQRKNDQNAKLVEAPIFYPTEKEFLVRYQFTKKDLDQNGTRTNTNINFFCFLRIPSRISTK